MPSFAALVHSRFQVISTSRTAFEAHGSGAAEKGTAVVAHFEENIEKNGRGENPNS